MGSAVDTREVGTQSRVRDPSPIGIAAAAAALVAFMAFNAGGFFPGTTALVVLALLLVLVLFVTLARAPGAALRPRLLAAVGLLALFGLWQLISSSWSHAPGRAAVAFDLTLLYVLVVTVCGLTVDRPSRLRGLVLGVLAALVAACVAGLLSRTLPDVFPVSPNVANERLSFPLTYWNALGIIGACALILCLGLTSTPREHLAVRVATAAAVPALAATILFTFSRGSIAAGVLGALLMVAFAPHRHLLSGLLASVPPAIVAVVVAYDADALAQRDPTTAAAVSQGRTVIVVVAACCIVAGLLRAVLARTLDPVLARRRPLGSRVTLAIGAGVAVLIVVAGVAAGAPHRLDTAYDRFVHGSRIAESDQRERLTDPGNNGRLSHWRVALDAFEDQPVHGTGAGTYQNEWNRRRKEHFDVLNAHSLFLEELSETGVVGVVLLVLGLLVLAGGVLARLRGPGRPLWAAIGAAMIAWLAYAGIDWVWQMPAAGAFFFAFGAAALARPAVERDDAQPAAASLGRTPRLVAGIALLLVAITPVRLALSQAHLDDAIDALRAGDCRKTVSSALASANAFGSRAEPYELLAYCDARLGFGPLAETMVRRAVARDPGNWEYRYDLAIALGVQGLDPRPALADAQRLNPLSAKVYDFRRDVAGNAPRTWKRRAFAARLLLPAG